MLFRLKNKAGYPVLGSVAFAFAVLLVLNMITLFGGEPVSLGHSTAVAADRSVPIYEGHKVATDAGWVCVCGPPLNCRPCVHTYSDANK